MSSNIQIREYQKYAIDEVLSDNKSKDLVQLATGGGKTIIAGFLSETFLTDDKKVLFLAHREELLNQAQDKLFKQFGITSSIIKGKEESDLSIPMQIASIQTFHRRLNFVPDVIIIDEAHHAEASTYQKIIKSFPNAKMVGLTATPYRLSGKGFNKTFDRLITSKSIKSLEEELFLVQGKTFGYPIRHEKLLRAKYLGNDYTEQELNEIMNDRVLIEDIIVSYEKRAKGKKMIVFASSIKHSQAICQRFKEYGLNALHIDANTKDRSEIINEFRFGQTNILCNVGIATEGVDIPEIECVCLARPTMSLSLYLQMCGRGSRPSNNKKQYIILDHSNNYIEHGAPNKEHDWKAYFTGMSKPELLALKKGKQFKVILDDSSELIIDNILDIPMDIKGFALEEIENTKESNENPVSDDVMLDELQVCKMVNIPIDHCFIKNNIFPISIKKVLIEFYYPDFADFKENGKDLILIDESQLHNFIKNLSKYYCNNNIKPVYYSTYIYKNKRVFFYLRDYLEFLKIIIDFIVLSCKITSKETEYITISTFEVCIIEHILNVNLESSFIDNFNTIKNLIKSSVGKTSLSLLVKELLLIQNQIIEGNKTNLIPNNLKLIQNNNRTAAIKLINTNEFDEYVDKILKGDISKFEQLIKNKTNVFLL